MTKKEKGRLWDGRSRPTTDKYKENFDRIFGKKRKNFVRAITRGI